METNREKSMAWWNGLTFEKKFEKTIQWLSEKGEDTTSRHPHHLTGREIEEIYKLNNR